MEQKDIKEYYILFFDILGCSQNLLNKTKEEETNFINKVYDMIKSATEKDWDYKILTFSDNILVAIESSVAGACKQICHYAARIQEMMLRRNGLLIRGSITKGLLYVEDNITFNCKHNTHFVLGSGLVIAAELEKTAKYPRIIIDKNLFNENYIMNSAHTIFLDGDGCKSINFMNYYEGRLLQSRVDNFENLQDAIIKVLHILDEEISKKGSLCENLKAKKIWLCGYLYNFSIQNKIEFKKELQEMCFNEPK